MAEIFYMDGDEHDADFETCVCYSQSKPCPREDCVGNLHYQPVYGGYYEECDVCHKIY